MKKGKAIHANNKGDQVRGCEAAFLVLEPLARVGGGGQRRVRSKGT